MPLIRELVVLGRCDVNAQGATGDTALHRAARAGAAALCEYLIVEAGALSSIKNVAGETALVVARRTCGDKATLDLLRKTTP